uniref:serine/threonine-protein kinase n=1 Tax=Dokdonella sp. TaxID=2291710 RepID=UPI0027B92F32
MIEIPGYHIVRQLGRGGMSTVYLAIQQSVDREVALKVMSPALLVDPDFGTRFLREARIAARLHPRHVVGIHDVGHAGDLHYIAMEYVPGGPLPCGDGKPLPPAQALRIAREIAGALAYAHDRGIVHRDVKPDNILLREDGSAVLTDFGIAHAQEAALRMTRTGAIVGTPHYMSPEQARGRGVDGRSDLYSLGVVLYEMLLGQVPYRAGDSLAVGIMHISEPLPRLPTRLAALQGLLDRLLAKEPAQRYQHGNEVAAAIDALEQAQPPWAETAEVPPLPGPLRARSATPLDDLAPMFAVDRSTDAVPERTPNGRSEPSLGRIDELGADVDAPALRAQRERIAAPTPQRARSGRWLALGALLLMATLAWWNQDTLRHLLPRTSFNDTLSRAQQALDAGHLTGNQGDSARELFLAARAQDPDNDIARNGLEAVARRLLERGQQALAEDDLAAARSDLDAARELLGGGVAVDQLAQAIRQRDSQRDTQDATARSLDAAAAALAAGRLVGDDGAAALYQRVLDGDAGNAIAQAGLRKCADDLATQARTALAGGDIE